MVTGGYFSLFVRVNGAGRRNVLQEIPAAKSYRTCFRLFFRVFRKPPDDRRSASGCPASCRASALRRNALKPWAGINGQAWW
jgi:hypothetical protein